MREDRDDRRLLNTSALYIVACLSPGARCFHAIRLVVLLVHQLDQIRFSLLENNGAAGLAHMKLMTTKRYYFKALLLSSDVISRQFQRSPNVMCSESRARGFSA